MKRALLVVLGLGLLLGAACGKSSSTTSAAGATGATATGPTATGTETEPAGDCGEEPSPLAEIPAAVQGFPGLSDITVTNVEAAGPSTIVTGSTDADLDAVFESFTAAFEQGGFTVTSSEKEEDDAEVNFSGNSTTGQVKLTVPCEGRTGVSITIRPD